MKNYIKNLTEKETSKLLDAPIYVAFAGALEDDEFSNTEKRSAIDLVKTRTYSAPPILQSYYKEAEKNYEAKLEELDEILIVNGKPVEELIKCRIDEINDIIQKIEDKTFADHLKQSLKSFARHIANSETHYEKILAVFLTPALQIDLNK